MKANRILNLLELQEYDKLKEAAEKELRLDAAKHNGGSTQVKRQRTAEKVLAGAQIWENKGLQYIATNHFGFILSNCLELTPGAYVGERLLGYFREDPGNEVHIDWDLVYVAMEKNKARRQVSRQIIVKIGGLYINAQYLVDICAILGGEKLHAYEAGEFAPLQLESENGKAIIMPIRYGAYSKNPVMCIDKVAAPMEEI